MSLISDRFADDGKSVIFLTDLQKESIEKFNKKCSEGKYKFVKHNCECGSTDFDVIAKKDRYGIPMDTVICRNCGLIMTNPRLDDESNNAFYDDDYPVIYRDEEKPSEEVFFESKKAAGSIISFIRKHAGIENGKVLEIGCADGRNVAAFAEKGYDVCGIDLSHTYVEFGKSKGLNLFCCDAKTFSQKGHKFDIVVLNHVLEHFTDLRKELGIIKGMLAPEGVLFIAVPGVKALTFGPYDRDFLKLLQNAHVYNFTTDTLCNVMSDNGFKCIYCNEFIYSLFTKSDDGGMFRNAYADTIGYLTDLEKDRGNLVALLIDRAKGLLTRFEKGKVLLYGTPVELDALVQKIEDLSPIKGFLYSDTKTPEDVMAYIRTDKSDVECLMLIDLENNSKLMKSFDPIVRDHSIKVYSVYGEIF